MRPRGLKLTVLDADRNIIVVAAHAAAWIETSTHIPSACWMRVAAHAAAWIETAAKDFNGTRGAGRGPCGRVD